MDTETRGETQPLTALVTGAASGIGEAIAKASAAAGMAVCCADLNEAGAARVAGELREQGHVASSVRTDVTSFADVEQMVTAAAGLTGRIDVAFSNAGGAQGKAAPFLELDPDAWDTMLSRNFTAAFYVGLAVARHMAEAGGGTIVYTSSQLAFVAYPGLTHYAAAKAGVSHLVRSMAVELAPHDIRVNAVAPGPTATPGTETHFSKPDVQEMHNQKIPMKRLGEPAEIASAALFLASSASSFVTGTTLLVDGGYTLA